MAKHTVTVVALVGLLAAGGAAFYLNQRAVPVAAARPRQGGGAEEPGGEVRSRRQGPGKGPGGPAPVEVIELKPVRVLESIAAVGSLRSNESV